MKAAPPVQKDGPRVNEEIRVREVQLIDAAGTNYGTVPIQTALDKAAEAGLDLVEISPNAAPPVVKILDYGKYKFQAQKKAAEARKKQKVVEVKEIKFRPMIDDHDYDVKMRAMQRFFEEGDKVKITGHRLALAQATLDAEVPKQEVILPRKTVLELLRLLRDEETPIEMQFAGNQARFSFSGMEFVTKLVEGKFPDYNRVIPKNHKNSVTLGRQALLASLQRAAILTSEKFKGVRINIEPGSLRIASSNAEQEEAKEELEIDYGGDAIEIGFNVTYLMDALANMGSEMIKLELQDTAASALFTVPDQPGFKYVVMPMRI